MICKEYKRLDPGHKGTMVNIVFENIAVFSQYRPIQDKPPMDGMTVFCMTNGQVLLCEVDIKSVKQIFERNK